LHEVLLSLSYFALVIPNHVRWHIILLILSLVLILDIRRLRMLRGSPSLNWITSTTLSLRPLLLLLIVNNKNSIIVLLFSLLLLYLLNIGLRSDVDYLVLIILASFLLLHFLFELIHVDFLLGVFLFFVFVVVIW
jgi:hypothetical protein